MNWIPRRTSSGRSASSPAAVQSPPAAQAGCPGAADQIPAAAQGVGLDSSDQSLEVVRRVHPAPYPSGPASYSPHTSPARRSARCRALRAARVCRCARPKPPVSGSAATWLTFAYVGPEQFVGHVIRPDLLLRGDGVAHRGLGRQSQGPGRTLQLPCCRKPYTPLQEPSPACTQRCDKSPSPTQESCTSVDVEPRRPDYMAKQQLRHRLTLIRPLARSRNTGTCASSRPLTRSSA